jgi:hypothetical protein
VFFSLTLRVFFGLDSGRFLGAIASIFFGPALSFFFSQSTRPFGGKLLRLLLCAAAGVFFCVQAGLLFCSSLFGCFGTELRFNLCAQAGLFFNAQPGLLFSLPAGVLIRAPLFGFIHQPLRLVGGAQASLLTILNPFDLFFDRAESHLRASPQLILLRAFGGFRFEIASLLFGAPAGLFFFRLPQFPKLAIVGRLRSAEFLINLPAAQLFDGAHPREVLLRPINFVIGDFASLFFFRALTSFRLNSLPFVFSAPPGKFLFVLLPLFLFPSQRLLSG